MDAFIPEVVKLLAFEGDEGCTISELKSLIIKYAFPLKYFAELNDEVFLEICKKLLTRSDVVFEESARNTIESACSMTAEVEVLKVRCSKACIDRTLVGGQVSLLFQLSDNEMQLLKALGKKRFDGLLQAEMPKEVKEVNKSMIPHAVNTLLELGLAVKHRTQTEKKKKSKTSVNNFTYLVILPCFAPCTVEEPNKEEIGFACEAQKVQEDLQTQVNYRNAALTLLRHAPGQVLFANELRRMLEIDKHAWIKVSRTLIEEGLIEECVYHSRYESKKPESNRKTFMCVRLKKEREAPTRSRNDTAEAEDVPENEEEENIEGANVLAEGWPMFDIVKCFESLYPAELKTREVEMRCFGHRKRLKERFLDPLEKEHLVKKRKYQNGKEIGHLYTWNASEDLNQNPNNTAPSKDNRDSTVTPQHTIRHGFVMKLLKKNKFVVLGRLKKLYREKLESEGEKGPNLFDDKKTIMRVVEKLQEQNICVLETVPLRNKTTIGHHNVDVILQKGVELSNNLKKAIEKEDDKTRYKPAMKDTSHFEEVHEVAHLIQVDKNPVKLEEGQEGVGIVKLERKPTLEGFRGRKNQDYHATWWQMKLNGMLPGFVLRAWCLHDHMWFSYMQNQQNDASSQCPLDFKECILNMSVDDYMRIIGVPELPSAVFESECSKISELPLAIQEALYDRGAQKRTLQMIDFLKQLGLLEEHYHLESVKTSELRLKFLVTKKTHLVLKKACEIPRDYDFAIESQEELGKGEKKITFSLNTQHKCMLYWKCLRILCSNPKLFEKSQHLPPQVINRLTRKEQWLGDLSNRMPNFKCRRELVDAITNDPDILLSKKTRRVNKGKCKTLSLKYKIEESTVEDIAKVWTHLHWGIPAIATLNAQLMEESNVKTTSFLLGGEEKHVSYLLSNPNLSSAKGSYASLKMRRKIIEATAITVLGEETKKSDAASTASDVKLPQEDAMAITARAYAIWTLTQGENNTIFWTKIPHVPESLAKIATKYFKKLKDTRSVNKAMKGVEELCEQWEDEKTEAEVNSWKYPKELVQMCEEDEDLKDILETRGKSFAMAWYQKVKALASLARQVVKKQKPKPKPKKKAQIVKVDKKKRKQTKKVKAPVAEPTFELPPLQPTAIVNKPKKSKKKMQKPVQRLKEAQKEKKLGPSSATGRSAVAAAILSYCTGKNNLSKQVEDAFEEFLQNHTEADLTEGMDDMISNGLLQISELAELKLPAKAKQALHSSTIPRETLQDVHDRYTSQIGTSGPVRAIQEKPNTLDLFIVLSLLSVGAVSLQESKETLSVFRGDKNSLEEALHKPFPVDYRSIKIEEQARLGDLGELETQVRKCPSPQQGVEYDKTSIEQILLDEIRGTAYNGYRLNDNAFDTFDEAQVRATLSKLVDQGKVITVNVEDCTHYIHFEYSGRFCCKVKDGSGILPHRPWLTALGEVNVEVLEAIKTKILSLVFRSPGIKEEDILDQFESVFNELDVHEVLTFMVSSNLLSAREVKFKSGFGDSGATFQTTKHYFTRLLPHQFVGEWS